MLRSLKATLMLWVVFLIWLMVPVRSYFDLRGQVQRTNAAYDAALSDWALALGNLVQVRDGQPSFALNQQTEELLRASGSNDTTFYVVLDPAGRVLGGDEPLAQLPMTLRPAERRVFDSELDGRAVRIAAHAVGCGGGQCQVRVAETVNKRNQAHNDSILVTFSIATAAALAFSIAVWLVVSRAMRPLASVNDQLAQRSLDDLRPLRRGRMPTEVLPLVDAVDQLLQRVAADAARQRHFIADAAHQLRTPLTALRTESELALLEQHPQAVHATLQRMNRSAQRVARLADQLLALARTDASTQEPLGGERVDLKSVAQDAAQDWVPRALNRGADLGFQLSSAAVPGRRHLLGELLANLIHNALEYSTTDPERPARITVRSALIDSRPVLEVEDNGPGIPDAERERVFERFYRSPGSAGAGSGLGLAIVRDIAQAHGAQVALLHGEDGCGLRVRVSFPRAA